MILEDATYEAFLYLPMDLKLQSNKPIKAACDNCSKVRKISKYNYHSLCKSRSMKGNTNSLNYKHTEEHIALSRAGRKGYTHTEETNGNRDYWQKLITDKLHSIIIGWNV